jgi:GR25 family glycosyltransferase involved in LPS biosynthesis
MKEIIIKYKEEQVEKLHKWIKDNPGKVMNNHDIRISTCNTVLNGNFTIEEMKIVKEACLLLWRARTGISGWAVTAATYDELINLCENNNK